MTFTDAEIQNALDKTPEHVQDIIWSYDTALIIDKITDQNSVPKKQKSLVAEEVLYLLLGLTTKEGMPTRISSLLQVPREVGEKITTELTSQLHNQPKPATQQSAAETQAPQVQSPSIPVGEVPDADSVVPEKLELRPEGVEREAPQEPEPAAKPLTREDVMSALSPKRTMASDIASVKKSEEGGEKT